MAVSHALDYYPRIVARNLRRGRTDKVGLFVNNPIPFLSEYIARNNLRDSPNRRTRFLGKSPDQDGFHVR